MPSLHNQNKFFVASALLMVIINFFTLSISVSSQTIFVFISILLFGVPHGALDPEYGRYLFKIKSYRHWFIFSIIYLLIVITFIYVWLINPLIFIVLFFIISTLHFSNDLLGLLPLWIRLLYGGSSMVFPSLLHHVELTYLIVFLIGDSDAKQLVYVMHTLAIPYLALYLLACILTIKNDIQLGFLLFSLCLLTVFAQPLLGFTIYFCVMHSARHVIKTQALTQITPKQMLKVILLPMFGVFLIGISFWLYQTPASFEHRTVQVLFVLLAGLTVPHMLIVDFASFQLLVSDKLSKNNFQKP